MTYIYCENDYNVNIHPLSYKTFFLFLVMRTFGSVPLATFKYTVQY